jgi:hypothetical protein
MVSAGQSAADAESDGEPQLSAAARKLIDAAERMPPVPLFAVVDGAQHGDLPHLLRIQGLTGRSLFLDHADAEIEAASGWLVPLDGASGLAKLLSVSDEQCGSLVLWSCPLGETALHRHLRTINIVQIHQGAIPGDEPETVAENAGAESETPAKPPFGSVLFRHYDPDVIASLLPLLDEAQFARIFGPATHILMYSGGHGGLRSAPRPEGLPIAPRGPLRISAEQIEDLELAMSEARDARIGVYLRNFAPDAAAEMDDHGLARFVAESNASGHELGLTTERAQGFWAYMMLNSKGRIARDATVRDYVTSEPETGTPDDKVYNLMSELADGGG